MASYPGSIATFTAVTDTTGTIAVDHAGLHNQANGEVVAIETTLGVNAQGTDGTVAAKLIRIDGQSTGTGYISTTFQLNGITLSGSSASLGSAQVVCIGTNQLSTDGAMVSDSNNLVPSQKAVVTYVAAATSGISVINSVTSANANIQVANPTTAPVLTLNAGNSSGQVMIVNSLGAPPVFYPYVKVTNTQAMSTGGGTATASAWTVMPINTKDSDTASIATLTTAGAAYTVALPAGTYKAWGTSGTLYTSGNGEAQIRIYNSTGSSILLNGTSGFTVGEPTPNTSIVTGIFTLATPSSVIMQYWISSTSGASGALGYPTGAGVEVYSILELTKIG